MLYVHIHKNKSYPKLTIPRHFAGQATAKVEMLQQKQGHAQIFRHAFDAQMEWRTRCYTKLTMPEIMVPW